MKGSSMRSGRDGGHVKVRIGIAESDRVVELEVADPGAYEKEIEAAFAGDSALIWLDDSKKRRVGIPRQRIAFVEIETQAELPSVGFAPTP